MLFKNNWKFLSFALVVMVALPSCRGEEQNRVLSYDPGVYKGKKVDRALTKKELADLRQRGRLQSD